VISIRIVRDFPWQGTFYSSGEKLDVLPMVATFLIGKRVATLDRRRP
jgi:hypothetical protein